MVGPRSIPRGVVVNGPWSLDELLEHVGPVTHVARCNRCRRVAVLSDGNDTCGPNFEGHTFCSGAMVLITDPPQDALMAAYRLGGELGVLSAIFDGCKDCSAGHMYGAQRRCTACQRLGRT